MIQADVGSGKLSPECRLVFRTASVSLSSAEVSVLVADIRDWERVVVLAEREVATSRVARVLLGHPRVPTEVLSEMQRRAVAMDLRMQYLSRRVQQLCGVFAHHGIPFMLLKGAAVGALVDPTFTSRPMKDIDILVRHEDVSRAAEAIVAAGWSPSNDEVLRNLLADAHHLPPFVDPRMPDARIELHVAALPHGHPFELDEASLWRHARPAPRPFTGALLPSTDHLLLHACVHFAWQHPMVFGAWRTFRLLTAVAGTPDFDWLRLSVAATHARATTSVYWTLRLGTRLSGINTPPEVMTRLTPPTPKWMLAALERHFIAMIAVGEMPPSPSVALNRRLWLAAIRPEWSGHSRPRKWDPENTWGRAYGHSSAETGLDRLVRHTRTYRRWTDFVTKTLFG